MRRVLVVPPALLLLAASPPVERSGPGKDCLNHGIDYATAKPNSGGFRRLDQLPPANEILTVIHSVDGCEKPVIVRYNVGTGR
ncbi:hypothetical protein [Sphingomonas oryzagri]|uniref:Secreted protein n=1 Tax=Sphingomonas oryzagri TaxID=3042314 RepID=A0ABT6N143_9SPHN|nr:hypothetical protein [Sphingomonas oryzagri]MDH7639015.1 hypothetical protein [Sphingomonas oryzagri]